MNLLEKLQAQKVQVAIQVYKEAGIKEPKVLDTFPVRVPKDPTSSTKIFTTIANCLYDFLRNDYSNYPLKKTIEDITVSEVTDAIAQFSKIARTKPSLDDFFYNPLYSTSQLLATIGAMRLQNTSNFNLSMLSDSCIKLLDKLCLKSNVEPRVYATKLYDWYEANKERIKNGNRGTFEISVLKSVDIFISSVLSFGNDHGIVYVGNLQWIKYVEHIKDIYHVDIDCIATHNVHNVIEYKKDTKPLWYWCLDVNERRELE